MVRSGLTGGTEVIEAGTAKIAIVGAGHVGVTLASARIIEADGVPHLARLP